MSIIEREVEQEVEQPPVGHDDPVVRVLQGAIRIIERDGWCQREMHNPAGQHCMIGGVGRAGRELGIGSSDQERAVRYLARARSVVSNGFVPMWNDCSGRTWPEVREAMMDAVELRRAELWQ